MKDLLETRLELLKTNLFLIDMIDRWSEEDSKRYDELSKEIKEVENEIEKLKKGEQNDKDNN